MNWGSKIAIVFVGFVVLIISMVTICMRQKDIHLVAKNYYEKEIAYQDQIDIETNTAGLSELPVIDYIESDAAVTVNYPAQFKQGAAIGKIVFFRPSDANKDFTIALNAENNKQVVPVGELEKGFWKIQMEWTLANKKYYLEEKLVVL